MLRRNFLKTTIIAAGLLAPLGAANAGSDTIEFKPGVIKAALAKDKTVVVNYGTKWCTTCAAMERQVNALRKENPAYNDMVFVLVDWDKYSSHSISTDHKIPRRSTFIVLKGDKEVARIVANPSKKAMKELLDKGLSAANV